MKHLKLFATLSIISLLAVWSMATIEVQTTVPLVDPNGSREIVGTFRMVFSAPEFGDPLSEDTTYYTLVRIHMANGVKLVNVGGLSMAQVAANPVPVAWEVDFGAPFVTKDYTAIRIFRFTGDYLDLLFSKNMFANEAWQLSTVNRLRCTIGTPQCQTPTVAPINHSFEFLPAAWQQDCDMDGTADELYQRDTRLCCDFSVTTQDFMPIGNDFWKVGITAYVSDIAGNLGPTYNVNFQPADPSLAQKGVPGQTCTIEQYWPCKYDPCVFEDWVTGCNEAPEVHVCPTPPPADQNSTPGPCASSTVWINENYSIDFGAGHWFSIVEDCPTGLFAFAPGGTLTITLQNPSPACAGMNPIFNGMPAAFLFDPNEPVFGYYPMSGVISGGGSVITFTLPNEAAWTTFDPTWGQYCILVDLDSILINTCCLLNLYVDDVITLSVKAEYTPYNYHCGYKPAPITFDVAYIYGCIEPDPEPVAYDLYLWFPFLPPVNNPDVNWWCGVALTNYAAQPTDDGIFWMWEEDGDEYSIVLPPLGAHEMWLRNLTDPDFMAAELSAGYSDTMWGDEAMSGIVVYTVWDTEYPPNYMGAFVDDGAIAGIDAFVLMGDFTQAYGYAARHVDGAQIWNDAPGRAPGWAKKGTK